MKAWLLGAVSTHPSAHSVFVTHFKLVLLNFHASWIHRNPVFMGHCKHHVWMGRPGMVWPHTLNGFFSASLVRQTSFTNRSSKLQLLRITRYWQQSIKPTVEPFWTYGSVWPQRSQVREGSPVLRSQRGHGKPEFPSGLKDSPSLSSLQWASFCLIS